MAWPMLVTAGLFEVLGVIGLGRVARKDNWPNNIWMIGSFIVSFELLLGALETIPLSTGYAVWTGIGTVGATAIGMLFFREPRTPVRLVCIAGIICCVIGLRLTG